MTNSNLQFDWRQIGCLKKTEIRGGGVRNRKGRIKEVDLPAAAI